MQFAIHTKSMELKLLWIWYFEAISHPGCYLTSAVHKSHNGPVIALFCAISAAFLAMSEVS